jgi:hypothetical protein
VAGLEHDDAQSNEEVGHMPWCGYWGTGAGGLWWLLPLIGLAFMAVMLFVCSRGFGCMGRRRRTSGELSELQREVEGSKEDARELRREPS